MVRVRTYLSVKSFGSARAQAAKLSWIVDVYIYMLSVRAFNQFTPVAHVSYTPWLARSGESNGECVMRHHK